eukprot:TRINITY_DN14010_c0_g1_i1.p1 TRINITY_DN14010_c0_g1~~TRINITY_DN14010_c0_g1_i1.p1  ORF type:complete len:563 (-),score=78.86 TRINITY_DN14010_c0_g1_i1:701-2389(-)
MAACARVAPHPLASNLTACARGSVSPCHLACFHQSGFPLQPMKPFRRKSLPFPPNTPPPRLHRPHAVVTMSTENSETGDRRRFALGEETGGVGADLGRRFSACLAAAGVSLALLLGQPTDALAGAAPAADGGFNNSVMVSFPMSKNIEVARVQRTLVEAWNIVHETYVDGTFNNQDWERQLESSLVKMMKLETKEAAYDQVREMLASLDDPYTRIITPQEYRSFRITNDGSMEGVGLLVSFDTVTKKMVVLSPIEGGPAARAGIRSGDVLVQIDDEVLHQQEDPSKVAERLRGQAGTPVTLQIFRKDANGQLQDEPVVLTLKREAISLSPVFAAVLPHPATDGSTDITGYIRLASFSQNAASDVEKAIARLHREGAKDYILDLRNDPGGLVKAGLDIADMWLDGQPTLVTTMDRSGRLQGISAISGSPSLTDDPLVILVNSGSASASEILAGALHDNGRAILVGETTYGKGKIQSVYELRDGSALLVTVAKYLSPALHPIDKVGLSPDVSCMPDGLRKIAAPVWPGKMVMNQGLNMPSVIEDIQLDGCVIAAEQQLLAMAHK